MLLAQDGRCANEGCRTDAPGPHGWHTDHDHGTGNVRALLCHSCNLSLGNMKDDPVRLEGLAAYIRRFHASGDR